MSKTFTSKNFEEERMRMGNFGPPLALRDRSPAHKTENKIILFGGKEVGDSCLTSIRAIDISRIDTHQDSERCKMINTNMRLS